MCSRIALAVLCAWCVACGPKDQAPTTVDPDATQPVTASNDPDPMLDEGDELDEADELDEEEPPDEGDDADEEPSADDDGQLTFKFHNLCKRSVKYIVAPIEGEVEVDKPETIKGGAVKEITTAPDMGVHIGEGDKHSAAQTQVDGGHVWISSSCKGVGSSNDPKADPAELDRKYREALERAKSGG